MTYKNKKLLELARQIPCTLCGKEDGTIVAAHSNQQKDGKGTGIKSADYRIASLCYGCHLFSEEIHELIHATPSPAKY